MRWLPMAALCLMAAVCSTVVASADVVSFGRATFDFDAPSPPLTAGQRTLFQRYKDAVNRHDETALMSLQDDSMKSCAVVSRMSILQDLKRTIPDDAKIRFFAATEDLAQEMGFGDLAYLSTRPTAVLGIDARTKSEHEIKIVTILRPVRQAGEIYALVPYCLTEKGKALIDQKSGTQQ